MSLELLGAIPLPRGILIQVRNAGALAAKEGGAAGQIASALVPQTIEGVVLDKMVEQFKTTLRDRGVDAEVSIVSPAGQQPAKHGFTEGMVTGGALAGGAWAAWRFVISKYLMPSGR